MDGMKGMKMGNGSWDFHVNDRGLDRHAHNTFCQTKMTSIRVKNQKETGHERYACGREFISRSSNLQILLITQIIYINGFNDFFLPTSILQSIVVLPFPKKLLRSRNNTFE